MTYSKYKHKWLCKSPPDKYWWVWAGTSEARTSPRRSGRPGSTRSPSPRSGCPVCTSPPVPPTPGWTRRMTPASKGPRAPSAGVGPPSGTPSWSAVCRPSSHGTGRCWSIIAEQPRRSGSRPREAAACQLPHLDPLLAGMLSLSVAVVCRGDDKHVLEILGNKWQHVECYITLYNHNQWALLFGGWVNTADPAADVRTNPADLPENSFCSAATPIKVYSMDNRHQIIQAHINIISKLYCL